MLFNSLAFLIFFPTVVLLYWILPVRFRNTFLLLASYYFYMNWEPVFALLILFTSFSTWGFALILRPGDNNSRRRNRIILWSCLIVNLAILFIFKYAGFFSDIVRGVFGMLHIGMYVPRFELLLPVGISFYTFQAIGYIVDVLRGTVPAERHFGRYALFVSFFPQLVAGPIERASNLLPQFSERHLFSSDSMIYGFRLMIMGYFMKLCVADNLSPYVDAVYNNLPMHSGKSVIVASLFFTFQILCDFGGYSLIAIGTARCMGFRLMQNFRQPYHATSIRDFWRRWHISLSSWFSDYIYIPLGGNRVSKPKHYRNLFVTFLVSGLWHGADATFVVWGAYHGVLISAQAMLFPRRKGAHTNKDTEKKRTFLQYFKVGLSIIFTFILVVAGWVFFRANSISDAFLAFSKMVSPSGALYTGAGIPSMLMGVLMIGLLMMFEIYNERHNVMALSHDGPMTRRSRIWSITVSALLLGIILSCGEFNGGQFIYFQF